MTRIEKILSLARLTLADPDGDRYTDENLLLLLDEGHKDICRHTQLLHGREDIWLQEGEAYFDFPDDLWLVTRVTYDMQKLNLVSHTELDHVPHSSRRAADFNIDTSKWEDDTGYPEAVVYDRRNMLQGRIYPIPDSSIVERNYTFSTELQNEYQMGNIFGVFVDVPDDVFVSTDGVTTGIDDFTLSSSYGVLSNVNAFGLDAPREFAGDEYLGVVVAIDKYTINSLYGIVVDLYDPSIRGETFNSLYGVIVDATEIKAPLTVHYIKNPKDITRTSDELDTPYMYDTALKYYVVGHAFLNDLDSQYQAKGAQQLAFYDRELQIANKTQARDGTRASQFNTDYRRVF